MGIYGSRRESWRKRMNYKNTTVVIPALNEEKNILLLINAVKRSYRGIHILVVDDGSTDNTRRVTKKIKGVKLLDRSKKKVKGLSISVLEGIRLSRTKFVIVMDSDLQHPPGKIKEIATKLMAGNDIVVATRKSTGKWSFSRKTISKIANTLGTIRLMFRGSYVKDPMSGFFGIKKEVIKKIRRYEDKFEKTGYKILFDILKYCGKVKVDMVYYVFGDRKYGTSKIGKKHIISYLKALFK